MNTPEIKVVPDPAAVAKEAADRIVIAAEKAIELGGSFSIALSGGSTPKALFTLLAQEPYASAIQWTKVLIFFGDERTVPPDHADSNYRMAKETLLSKVPIPGDNVYRMRGEIDPQEAAKEYGEMLKERFGDGGIDLVLLGMGDDGHTASLFPHSAGLKETKHRVIANYVEKMKTWRVSMSYPFLNRSHEVLILVTGANKAKRIAEVLEGPENIENLPIQGINPAGKLAWIMDAPAAGMTE